MMRHHRKNWYHLLLCGFLLLFVGGLKIWAETAILSRDATEHHFDVRVLLAKEFVASSGERDERVAYPPFNDWVISSTDGFIAADQANGLNEMLHEETLNIGVRNMRLTVNGRRLKTNTIDLRPVSGVTHFGKYRYAGTIRVMLEENGEIYLVNQLDIEDYIFSVLRWESVPSWPLEANKAMAIACRTYVVNKVLLARRGNNSGKRYHYDVRATNAHQTYRGLHEYDFLRTPVDETCGVVMAFRRPSTGKLEVLEALYDACCGGSAPSKMNGVVDFDQAPYLKRSETCHFCNNCKLFNWRKEYTRTEVENLMRFSCPSLFEKKTAHVTDMRVSKRDGSNVVHQIQVKIGKEWYSLTGEQTYSIFRGIKSRMFTVKTIANRIVFKGRGVGHGLGLCQWGAYKMARMGKTHKEILTYYYTDAIIFTTVRVAGD